MQAAVDQNVVMQCTTIIRTLCYKCTLSLLFGRVAQVDPVLETTGTLQATLFFPHPLSAGCNRVSSTWAFSDHFW